MRKVKPAIFSGPNGWGWVSLGELSEIVGQKPADLVKNFFKLTKDIEDGVLTFAFNVAGELFGPRYLEQGDWNCWVGEIERGWIFVPAGWAMDVIKAASLGAARVDIFKYIPKDHWDAPPEGTLRETSHGFESWAAIGIKADGTSISVPPAQPDLFGKP